jgi:CRP/FNR family transcriptional regulator, cyclic AMP receptor protein
MGSAHGSEIAVRLPIEAGNIRESRQARMNEPNELKKCPLLAGVPPEDLHRDCPAARIVAIRHRGTIYRQGEAGRTVYCVLDGQVTIARTSHDGATLTTAALGAGDFFGPALSGVTAAEDTARAKGTASIWRAPIDEFRRLLLHHPALSWEFVSLLAMRQRQMERRLESFAFKRTEARLAQTFRELSGGFATRCNHGFGQHLRLTQQELADLVGASRPVVSTILNKLRDQGVLGYNREYVCVRGFEEIARLIDS